MHLVQVKIRGVEIEGFVGMNKLPVDTQHPVLAADGPEVTMQAIAVNYKFGIDTIEEFNIIHLPEADWVEAGQGYSKVVHEYTFG